MLIGLIFTYLIICVVVNALFSSNPGCSSGCLRWFFLGWLFGGHRRRPPRGPRPPMGGGPRPPRSPRPPMGGGPRPRSPRPPMGGGFGGGSSHSGGGRSFGGGGGRSFGGGSSRGGGGGRSF